MFIEALDATFLESCLLDIFIVNLLIQNAQHDTDRNKQTLKQ